MKFLNFSLIRGYPICCPRLEGLLPGDPFPSRPVCKKTKQCGFIFACLHTTVFTQSLKTVSFISEENFALKKLQSQGSDISCFMRITHYGIFRKLTLG